MAICQTILSLFYSSNNSFTHELKLKPLPLSSSFNNSFNRAFTVGPSLSSVFQLTFFIFLSTVVPLQSSITPSFSLLLSSFCLLSSLYSFLSLQVYVFILSSTVFERRYSVIVNNNDSSDWFHLINLIELMGQIHPSTDIIRPSFEILSSFQRLLPSSSLLIVVSIPPLSHFGCFFHPSNCISSSSDLHP